MIPESSLRWKMLALLAPAGALAGHCMAYVLAIPDAALRASVLAEAGHAWMDGVVAPLGVLTALLGVFLLYTRHLRAGPRAELLRREVCGWLAPRLAVAQFGAFSLLEVLERVVLGVPLAELITYGLLQHGAGAQAVVAVALTAAAWLVALGAERLSAREYTWWAPSPRAVPNTIRPGVPARSQSSSRALGARAPPR